MPSRPARLSAERTFCQGLPLELQVGQVHQRVLRHLHVPPAQPVRGRGDRRRHREHARHQPRPFAHLGELGHRRVALLRGPDRVAEGDADPGVGLVGDHGLLAGRQEVRVRRPGGHPGQRAAPVPFEQLRRRLPVGGAGDATAQPAPRRHRERAPSDDQHRQQRRPHQLPEDEQGRPSSSKGRSNATATATSTPTTTPTATFSPLIPTAHRQATRLPLRSPFTSNKPTTSVIATSSQVRFVVAGRAERAVARRQPQHHVRGDVEHDPGDREQPPLPAAGMPVVRRPQPAGERATGGQADGDRHEVEEVGQGADEDEGQNDVDDERGPHP